MANFHERLSELRKSRKMTQKQLSELLAVNVRTVQYYESGKKKPGFDVLALLADAFGVSTDYLLGISDDQFVNSIVEQGAARSYQHQAVWESKVYTPRNLRSFLSSRVFVGNNPVERERAVYRFSKRLRELSDDYGMDQDVLARKIGVNVGTIRDYELPSGDPPSQYDIERVANLFNVSIRFILGYSEDRIPENWAQTIQERRMKLGLSIKEFADAVGVEERVAVMFEEYSYCLPFAHKLVRIAEVLNVSPRIVFDAAEYMFFDESVFGLGTAPDQNPLLIELSDEQLNVLRDVMSDPNMMLMFQDFAKSTEEERRMMLDVWSAIRKRGDNASPKG